MSEVIRTERYPRGFFGKLFHALLVPFNVAAVALMAGFAWIEPVRGVPDDVVLSGFGTLVSYWIAGDVALGILVTLTRGAKVVREQTIP